MPKMSDADLRALLAAEKADALSAMAASKLSEERAAALDYYLGDMSRDMPAPDGRSKAVSTDVADTVELRPAAPRLTSLPSTPRKCSFGFDVPMKDSRQC